MQPYSETKYNLHNNSETKYTIYNVPAPAPIFHYDCEYRIREFFHSSSLSGQSFYYRFFKEEYPIVESVEYDQVDTNDRYMSMQSHNQLYALRVR